MLTKVVTLGILFGGNFIVSIIRPIRLPPEIVSSFTELLFPIWQWNGIIPVEAIFRSIGFVITLGFYYISFVIIFWIVGMFTGQSAPKV